LLESVGDGSAGGTPGGVAGSTPTRQAIALSVLLVGLAYVAGAGGSPALGATRAVGRATFSRFGRR
jgi:hypothetical protein